MGTRFSALSAECPGAMAPSSTQHTQHQSLVSAATPYRGNGELGSKHDSRAGHDAQDKPGALQCARKKGKYPGNDRGM